MLLLDRNSPISSCSLCGHHHNVAPDRFGWEAEGFLRVGRFFVALSSRKLPGRLHAVALLRRVGSPSPDSVFARSPRYGLDDASRLRWRTLNSGHRLSILAQWIVKLEAIRCTVTGESSLTYGGDTSESSLQKAQKASDRRSNVRHDAP